jgi:hypothetical protein
MTAEDDAVTRKAILLSVRWVKPTAGGDDLEITDTDGNTVLLASASGANVTHYFDMHCLPVEGIIVKTLDAGTVVVQVA